MDFSKIINAVKSGDFSLELRQDIGNALEYTAEHIQQYGGRQPTDIFNAIRQETTQEQYAAFDRWWSGEKDFCYASHAGHADSEPENEKDERINAGMFAKVKLNTILYEGYITVPESAVIELDGTNILYVASSDGTTVSKREVTLGHSVDNTVQVLSGIEEGERVVVEGIRLLYDGALIKDIQKTEAE